MAHPALLPVSYLRRGPPVQPGGDGQVIVMCGDYDLVNADSLSKAISLAVVVGDDDLIIDMDGVTFLDASTIRVLIGAQAALADRSRSLLVRSPSACVCRIFEVCDLTFLLADAATRTEPTCLERGRVLVSPVDVPAIDAAHKRPTAVGVGYRSVEDRSDEIGRA